jgi:hypothetical protein
MINLHLPKDLNRVHKGALVDDCVMSWAEKNPIRGTPIAIHFVDRLTAARTLSFGRHDVGCLAEVDCFATRWIDLGQDLAACRKCAAIARLGVQQLQLRVG